jgi:PIN domain nuclease of toxin-antitoxin system
VILLDTHAWVWWLSQPARLPDPARAAIAESLDAGRPVQVSAISAWEVALLVERGRLELTIDVADWIARAESAPEMRFVPVDHRVGIRSEQLVDFPHKDPADRMIVATALNLGAALITADRRLRDYAPVTTIWD